MGLAKALQGTVEGFSGYTKALGKKEERDFLSKESQIAAERQFAMSELGKTNDRKYADDKREGWGTEFDDGHFKDLTGRYGETAARALRTQFQSTGKYDVTPYENAISARLKVSQGTGKPYDYRKQGLDEAKHLFETNPKKYEEMSIIAQEALGEGAQVQDYLIWNMRNQEASGYNPGAAPIHMDATAIEKFYDAAKEKGMTGEDILTEMSKRNWGSSSKENYFKYKLKKEKPSVWEQMFGEGGGDKGTTMTEEETTALAGEVGELDPVILADLEAMARSTGKTLNQVDPTTVKRWIDQEAAAGNIENPFKVFQSWSKGYSVRNKQ